jgi:geranylgeranyl reductase family protein
MVEDTAVMYDVVVVGAGPAGSTAAKVLRERGVSVLLLDKASFPRDKMCGGGMPTRVWKRFPYIEPYLDSLSYGSVTYSMSCRYRLRVVRDAPLLGMVQRREFDNALLQLAIQAGVEFRPLTTVTEMQVKDDRVVLTLASGEMLESRIVLGCDGMNSLVARKAGLPPSDVRCVCLVGEHPMSPEQIASMYSEKHLVHLFIKAQGVAGYGWVFPKKDCVNIGIGEFSSAIQPGVPRRILKESYSLFVAALKKQGLLPAEFPDDDARGAILPIFPSKKTYSNRVMVCGDAAGFINPITGEGIYYAMSSGLLAAGVAADALASGDCSAGFLEKYQHLWWREFGRDLKILGGFNKQWGKNSERVVKLLIRDRKLAKLTIGVTGGQISFSKYLGVIFVRYLYAAMKEALMPSKPSED